MLRRAGAVATVINLSSSLAHGEAERLCEYFTWPL